RVDFLGERRAAAPRGPGPPPSTKELLRHDTQRCETYHTSAQSCKAAAGANATDRAQTMGCMALDAKGGWELAETAVHGTAARAARQHERFQHMDGLFYSVSCCAGWAR